MRVRARVGRFVDNCMIHIVTCWNNYEMSANKAKMKRTPEYGIKHAKKG